MLVGIIIVMLIRARQIWSARRDFGYNIYTADSLRQRIQRWALISVGVLFKEVLFFAAALTKLSPA